MLTIFDLPYDILQQIFTDLSAVDVLNFLVSSRKLYFPLIDDASTWRPFCLPFGVNDNTVFGRRRSYRLIYGRLLHRYGALLGWWCSDYPYKGNIIEFRLVPDRWLRNGEHIIAGDVWKLAGDTSQSRPSYPTYTEFIQIGFTPWRKSTPQTADDIQVSWHLRSESDLGFLVHNGMPPPWIRMDGGGSLATPSLHVIAPSPMTLVSHYFAHDFKNPEFPGPDTSAWLDNARGSPRLPQEGLPPILRPDRWWYTTGNRYVEGSPKPASISIFPPPADQESDVRLPDLHNPEHPLSSPMIPRYYPLRTVMQEGIDPASPHWRPESLTGLWLGDYGPHGTECLFLEHDAAESKIRAWKITGDVNVPRGICSWHADLAIEESWEDPSGRKLRAFRGEGRIAHHGFVDSTVIPARVIMSARDEVLVEWDTFLVAKFIRYRKERGRTGDK